MTFQHSKRRFIIGLVVCLVGLVALNVVSIYVTNIYILPLWLSLLFLTYKGALLIVENIPKKNQKNPWNAKLEVQKWLNKPANIEKLETLEK